MTAESSAPIIKIDLILIYRAINLTGKLALQDYLLTLASVPFSFIMFTAFPMAVHRILEVRYEKLRNRILIILNLLLNSIQYFPVGSTYNIETGTLNLGPLFALTGIGQLTVIIYSVLLLAGFLTLIFIPGFFHDITYSMGRQYFDISPAELIFFPLYYFILSLIVIIYSGRYFIAITQLENSTQLSEELLIELGRKHGLTEREKEVIPLIVEGMSNKQIAVNLFISTKTVDNHIYNIYKKLEINSRFELLYLC